MVFLVPLFEPQTGDRHGGDLEPKGLWVLARTDYFEEFRPNIAGYNKRKNLVTGNWNRKWKGLGMSKDFQQKYVGIVAGTIGAIVLVLGLLGIIFNLQWSMFDMVNDL